MTIGAGILYFLTASSRKSTETAASPAIATVKVHKGTIERRLRVAGQTSARNFATITAPLLRGPDSNQAMVLLKLTPSGTFVKKGDVVAEFDPQTMKDHLDDTIAGLRDKENDVQKRRYQLDLDMENLQQSLRLAKASVDKAKLDVKTLEVRTDIDREMLRLAVEESEAAYKELQTDVPQKIASQKADLRIMEIGKKMEELHVQRHEEDLRRLVVKAPMDGMVVLQSMPRPGGDTVLIAIGDRVGPGQPFMKIIDQKTMQVEATINQTESGMFRIGQQAAVSLDAFPGATYGGSLYSIGALAVGSRRAGDYIRSIPVRLQLTNPDTRVIPELSASADVLLEKAQDVLLVPAGAVEQVGDKSYVYVKGQQGFEKRAVTAGTSSGTEVAVLDGLKEGEIIRAN